MHCRNNLKQATRVEGTMLNLSGGGLCVRLKEAQTETPQGVLVVDPQFRGPFPLAGLVCGLVSGEGRALRLRFVDLPAHREAAIVRAIYRRQVGLWDEAQAAPLRQRERRKAVP
jgi:c-di-GMP-binding flagellar brake protein YcgR